MSGSKRFGVQLAGVLKRFGNRRLACGVTAFVIIEALRLYIVVLSLYAVTMRYWWVNHGKTYKYEVPGGFLWSPKTRTDGGRNYFYDSMKSVSPGDIVFSYCDTLIRAIGIVQNAAITAPKPNFRNAGSNWSDEGWYVEVEFSELAKPLRPKEFIDQIRPLLAKKYAPLHSTGVGLQGIYLTEISRDLGELLALLSEADLSSIRNDLEPIPPDETEVVMTSDSGGRMLEGDLEKIQLTKSRRGQGVFKANVRLVEKGCRITGVTNIRHLRASHIKPWAVSNNEEKLDGHNGLLLSPHVDHLFNDGFITFKRSGDLLVSRSLSKLILHQWSIDPNQNVGPFSEWQEKFLEYHRDLKFTP